MDGRLVFTARSPQEDVRSRCSSNTFAFQPFKSPSDSSFLCAGKSRKTRALSLSGENCIMAGFACALKAWLFLQTQGRDGLASTAWSQPLRGAGHAQLIVVDNAPPLSRVIFSFCCSWNGDLQGEWVSMTSAGVPGVEHLLSICPHKCRKSRCMECGGSQICEHDRERGKCKECLGSAQKSRQSTCKDCDFLALFFRILHLQPSDVGQLLREEIKFRRAGGEGMNVLMTRCRRPHNDRGRDGEQVYG